MEQLVAAAGAELEGVEYGTLNRSIAMLHTSSAGGTEASSLFGGHVPNRLAAFVHVHHALLCHRWVRQIVSLCKSSFVAVSNCADQGYALSKGEWTVDGVDDVQYFRTFCSSRGEESRVAEPEDVAELVPECYGYASILAVVKGHVNHDEVALAHIVKVVAEEVANLRALLPLQIEVVDNEHIGFAFLARELL